MNKIFRIFIVGSAQSLRLIDKYFKQESKFDSNLVLTESKSIFLKEYNTESPDLIIVDSSEADLSDSFILSFTKTRDPQLPLILLKNKMDRDTSIKLITSGASDVIDRRDMSALLSASHRELIANESLKKRANLMEKAYDLAKMGSWEIDLMNDSIYWSEQVREIFEVPRDFEPTIENGINFYANERYRNEVRTLIERLEKSGVGFQFEARITSFKETEKWIRVFGDSLVVGGQTVKIFGTTQDITKRKDTEFSLNEVSTRLANIIEQSNNLYYEHDLNGKVTYVSPQFKEFLKLPAEHKTDLIWTDFITDHPKNLKGIEITERALRTGKGQPPYELQIRNGNGEPFWILVNETPIIKDGKITGMVGTLTDITEVKKTQSEVEKLSLVAQKTQNLVVITDKDGKTEWANDAFINKTGYSFEEMQGKKPGDVLQGPETDPRTVDKISKLLKKEKPFSVTILNYTKAGEKYWLKMDVAPVFDEEGNLKNFFSIQEDITKKRGLQNELREIQKFYNLAVEGAEVGLWELNLKTYKTFFNPVFYEMLGYKKEDVTFSKDFHNEIIHPESHEIIEGHMQKIIAGQENSFEEIIQMKAKTGEYRWILDRAKVVKYKDGKPSKLAGSHIDVTDRIEAQKRSIQSEEQLELLIEASPVAIFQTDAEGVIVNSWNKEAERIFGYSRKEVTGKKFYDIADISKRDLSLLKLIQRGKILRQERFKIIDKDQNRRILEVSTGPIFDQNQKLQHTLVLATDITELYEQHQIIKKSNKEKTILLQEIHHRVKNNLAIISSLLELQLINGEDNMAIRKSIYRIKAIAEVHEQLYNTDNLSEIKLKEYFQNLFDSLIINLGDDQSITSNLNFDIETLNINQAIPLGILITELVTNSIKYAFNGDQSGVINLEILRSGEEKLHFKYSDSGVGFDFEDKIKSGGFGVVIITTILNQLTDNYETYNNHGFNLEFTFQEHERGSHSNIGYVERK